MSETIFSLQVLLCRQFQTLSPLSIRREKAIEVFKLVRRFNKYAKNETKKNNVRRDAQGNEIIRRPAPDTWF